MNSLSVYYLRSKSHFVDTKNHCNFNRNIALYAQQHPTRLGKQLLLKLSGYLFLKPLKI